MVSKRGGRVDIVATEVGAAATATTTDVVEALHGFRNLLLGDVNTMDVLYPIVKPFVKVPAP